MNQATVFLAGLALGLLLYAWRRGDGSHRSGLISGWQTLRRTLPLLLVAFAIVGYVDVLAPQDLVRAWIGPDSGWRGLLVGEAAGMLLPGGPYVVFPLMAAGMLLPGGPYVVFPLIATLYQAGAGLGPVLSMITSWAMLALLNVSFELPFLGWRFTAVRFGLALAFPPLVGLMGLLLFGG
jgi:uncharacterized membrane protein YraQ (UPF0718 family)